MAKQVLVQYLEIGKVFSISLGVVCMEYLTKEFFDKYSIDKSCYEVIFQRYDKEWDTFIDLEAKDSIYNRDKLRAVLTPLTQPAVTCNLSHSLEVSQVHIIIHSYLTIMHFFC